MSSNAAAILHFLQGSGNGGQRSHNKQMTLLATLYETLLEKRQTPPSLFHHPVTYLGLLFKAVEQAELCFPSPPLPGPLLCCHSAR